MLLLLLAIAKFCISQKIISSESETRKARHPVELKTVPPIRFGKISRFELSENLIDRFSATPFGWKSSEIEQRMIFRLPRFAQKPNSVNVDRMMKLEGSGKKLKINYYDNYNAQNY